MEAVAWPIPDGHVIKYVCFTLSKKQREKQNKIKNYKEN